MNEINENMPDDDVRFDLLVDGELTERQRRELLAGLDGEPGGWRCCALAFLEAQAWKNELGRFGHDPDGEPRRVKPSVQGTPGRSRFARRLATWTAMAASFLLTLTLGWWLQDVWHGAAQPSIGEIAEVDVPQRPSTGAEQPEPLGRATSPAAAVPSRSWQMVTLSSGEDAGDSAGSFQLPAIEREFLAADWATDLPIAIPDEVLQALQRTGHQVQRHRRLLPVEMEDGRRLVVPIDQIDVRYVGNPAL